jgi:hypothetical protein
VLILFCRALDAWRRLHGHRRVILTTMFREDYAATLVDRSAACHRLRSRWGEISHVDDMIRYLLRGSVLQRPHLSSRWLVDGVKIKAACPLASPATAHA